MYKKSKVVCNFFAQSGKFFPILQKTVQFELRTGLTELRMLQYTELCPLILQEILDYAFIYRYTF